MRRAVTGLVLAGMLLAGGIVAQQKKQQDIDLQSAIRMETVDGDLKGAIKQYGVIAAKYKTDRAVSAMALIHMAGCYQKMGDSESRKIYERVLREFADQKEAVAAASARLGGSAAAHNTRVATRQVWTGVGVDGDGSGSPSPDGRYLTFTNWATGDLGLRDLTSGTNRLLTNSGGWEASGDYAARSIISPDGRQVAYTWFLEKEKRNELRMLPLGTGYVSRPQTVYRSEGFRDYTLPCGWTPDGKQLLVIRSLPDRTSQIAMLSVPGGSMRVLKSFGWDRPSASLSPDGRYIAYDAPASDSIAARDILVLAADGSRETAAVKGPANDVRPMWSPDGSRIVFFSDRTGSPSLWSVPIEEGLPTGTGELVKADIGVIYPLGITRDGAFFYTLPGAQHRNVYLTELDGEMKATKTPVLATERYINSNEGPEWSPDGQSLAYYSYGNPSPGSTTLIIRLLKTGEERKFPLRPQIVSSFGSGPKWFPDGRSVLVLSREPQRPGIGYYRVELASGSAERLHYTDRFPSSVDLSPDGKTIFYIKSDNDSLSSSLMRFDIETHSDSELKQGEWFISLKVSPDGAELAYLVSHRPGSLCSISVMPAAGGEPHEVFRGGPWMDGSRYNTLAWTPDQRYLLFARGEVGDGHPSVLWRVPVTGGQPEKLGISMNARIKSPRIHPDGRRIIFGASENDANEIWVLENFLRTLSAKK